MSEPERKRPGRPRKPRSEPKIVINGISDKPHDDQHIIEFVYHQPFVLKRLFTLFKAYNSSEVEITFDKMTIRFEAIGHLEKNTIFARFNCQRLNHYYCKTPLKVRVPRDSLEAVFSSIDKNYNHINISMADNQTICILIQEHESQNTEHYEIEVVPDNIINSSFVSDFNDDADYPLKFTLPGKKLKRKLAAIKKQAKKFIISQDPEGDVSISKDNDYGINFNMKFKRSDKNIRMESTIPIGTVSVTSINIDYIVPFVNSNISEEINFACGTTQYMSMTACLDKIDDDYLAVVKVYVDIAGEHFDVVEEDEDEEPLD